MKSFSLVPVFGAVTSLLQPVTAQTCLTSTYFTSSWGISCSTNYGTQAVQDIATTTTTSYQSSLAMQINSTSSPTVTVTPAVVTTTSLVYTTTTATVSGSEEVETFSTTSTVYSSTSTTVTSTWTVTTCSWTTTTLTETTTVPIASDFRLIATSTATSAPTTTAVAQYNHVAAKRDSKHRPVFAVRQILSSSSSSSAAVNSTVSAPTPQNATGADLCQSPTQYTYPQCVDCIECIESATTILYIDIAPASTSTLCPSTTTTTVLSTLTTTSSLPPLHCTRTKKFITTQTATETCTTQITTTSTSTETATATTTITEYAACGTSNVLGPTATAAGAYIASANIDGALVYHDTAASAYECCVLCLTRENCAAAMFGVAASGSQCNLAMVDTCTAQGDYNGEFSSLFSHPFLFGNADT